MNLKKIISWLCVAAGLFLLVMAVVLSGDRINLLISGTTTQGLVASNNIVLGADRGCSASACSHPFVEFQSQDGRRLNFLSRFGAAESQYAPGERVEVIYTNGGATLAEINDFGRLWTSLLVTAGLGILLIATGFFYGRSKPPRPAGAPVRVKSNPWLKQNGYPIQAVVQSVARTMVRGDNPRPGWQIVTKGTAPRGPKTLVYRTEPLDFDPSGKVSAGDTLTVLVDPDNPDDYWIDTENLREAAT